MRARIYRDIDDERDRQEGRFGPQFHSWPVWSAILSEECGEVAEASLHAHWGDRFVAGDPRLIHLREELIQVAAVAVQMVEKIDSGAFPEPIRRAGNAETDGQ